MDSSDEEENKKIEENLPAEKCDENKQPKFQRTREGCSKIKLPHDTPVKISPIKRKSEVTVEDEIKRRRSTDSVQEKCDDENFADTSSVQVTILKTDHFVKRENLINTIAFPINLKEESVNERDFTKNQEDKSTSNEETIETIDEADSTIHVIPISTNKKYYDRTGQSKGNLSKSSDQISSENTNISSVKDRPAILYYVKSGETIIYKENVSSDEPTSEIRILDSESGDKSIASSNVFELSKKRQSDIPEKVEKKSSKSPKNVANRDLELSSDTPLPMNQNSTNTSNSVNSNISKSCEHSPSEKVLSPQKKNTPSPVLERKSQSRCTPRVARDYRLRSMEDKSNSIYDQPEPNYINLETLQKDPNFIEAQKQLLESYSQKRHSNRKVTSAGVYQDKRQFIARRDTEKHLKAEIAMLSSLHEFLQFQGRNIRTQLREMCEVDDYAENPDSFPPVENPYSLPPIVNPILSPPKKNRTDEIKEADYHTLKEYPGLAEEPAKVKKDARYQKRFYKQKPVKLPINWKVERDSSPETEPNSEEGQRDRIKNEVQIIFRAQKEKESLRNSPPILSKYDEDNTNKENKPREEILPQTFADGYQMSSFMEESPTSSINSIKSDKSNSPKANCKKKLPSTPVKHSVIEGLATRFMPNVSQISKSHTHSHLNLDFIHVSPLKPLDASPPKSCSRGASPLGPGSLGASPLLPGSPYASPLPGSPYASPLPGSPRVSPLRPGSPRVSPLRPGSPRVSPLRPGSPRVSPLRPGSPRVSPLRPGSPRVSPLRPGSSRVSPLRPGSPDASP